MTSNAKTVIPWRRCLHSLKLMHRRIYLRLRSA